MQRRLEKLERAQAVERERARIAGDIHDDIGTTLTRITMLSQPPRREPGSPQPTTAVLARIHDSAQEITRSLDEIVWAIDPRHDTLDSLADYMGKYSQDLLGAANIRCRLDLPADLPAWPLTAEIRHNLFLAFKEALNNILKHAEATEVCLSLHLRPPNAFVLCIADNGRGFDPRQPGPIDTLRLAGGHGLLNLQRRLAGIGGSCEIAADHHQGTRVTFTVTLPEPPASPPAVTPASPPTL
jgi:signal transduction histidine kinase